MLLIYICVFGSYVNAYLLCSYIYIVLKPKYQLNIQEIWGK